MKSLIQNVNQRTHGILNPSNCADVGSIPLAAWGSERLNRWDGIAASAVAFTVDWWDGPLARRLETASPLGEKVDAISDKIRLGIALRAIYAQDLAPEYLVKAVAAQNFVNAVITLTEKAVSKDESQIHSSWFGKRAIFAQQWGIASHVIAKKLENDGHEQARALRYAGNTICGIGLGLGAVATGGYAQKLWRSLQQGSD